MSVMSKTESSKLSDIGNKYAQAMGYKFISNGIWRSLTGRKNTALFIGKTIKELNLKFVRSDGSLNIKEIRRVNRAFPQQ